MHATIENTQPVRTKTEPGVLATLHSHWPEYVMEAAELGVFMVSACVFGVLLEHPMSYLNQAIEDVQLRRYLMGLAMGVTATLLILSRWGQRSGAHFNPSVTLTFLTLGKIRRVDAFFYVTSQFAGAIAGVGMASFLLGEPLEHSAVNFVATVPGSAGVGGAFIAESLISFLQMSAILLTANSRRFSHWTPYVAGSLVAFFIASESPLSGMSMNPARTLASALFAHEWRALWMYFAAPLLGMLAAAQLFRIRRTAHRVFCAKLHHHNGERCIFNCHYGDLHVTH